MQCMDHIIGKNIISLGVSVFFPFLFVKDFLKAIIDLAIGVILATSFKKSHSTRLDVEIKFLILCFSSGSFTTLSALVLSRPFQYGVDQGLRDPKIFGNRKIKLKKTISIFEGRPHSIVMRSEAYCRVQGGLTIYFYSTCINNGNMVSRGSCDVQIWTWVLRKTITRINDNIGLK